MFVNKSENEVNEWKEAVIDACVIDFINWYENDPRKTLQELCAYEQGIALDPRVSKDAQNLIDSTIQKCVSEIEALLSAHPGNSLKDIDTVKEYLICNLNELKGKYDGIVS